MTKAQKYVTTHLNAQLFEVENIPAIVDEDNGLSIWEKVLIFYYTKDGYLKFNEDLRSSRRKTRTQGVLLLNAALRKLPDYQGVVHRTAHLTKKKITEYKRAVGKTITEPTFVSTSKSSLIARVLPDFNVKFRIKSKHGKSIEDISYMGVNNPPNEEEVLFIQGTAFTILDVTDHDGYVLIIMEEV